MNDLNERKDDLWQQFLTQSGARKPLSKGMKVFLVAFLLFIGWLVVAKWG